MASKSPGMAMPFYAHLSSHDFEHPDGLPTSEWGSSLWNGANLPNAMLGGAPESEQPQMVSLVGASFKTRTRGSWQFKAEIKTKFPIRNVRPPMCKKNIFNRVGAGNGGNVQYRLINKVKTVKNTYLSSGKHW